MAAVKPTNDLVIPLRLTSIICNELLQTTPDFFMEYNIQTRRLGQN